MNFIDQLLIPDTGSVLVLLGMLLGTYWVFYSYTKRNYPPGPSAWPLIGHLPRMISSDRLTFFSEAADRHGPVTTIWLGPQPLILLSSPEVVKEAFLSNADLFSDRPFMYTLRLLFGGKRTGISFNNGESHKAMRRVARMALHDFGLGKLSLEEKIQDEVNALSNELQKSQGRPINDIKWMIQQAVSNVIFSICFGNRLNYDDEDLVALNQKITLFVKNNIFLRPENVFPILRYLPIGSPVNILLETQSLIRGYVQKQIAAHKTSFDPNNIRDFVDLYIKAENDNDGYFNAENLFRVIVDLFQAGSETTSTMLSWTILYLLLNPSVQDKAQQEISTVLGRHSIPTAKDRDQLVYVDAVLHEVMRIANIVPLGAPRFLTKPASVCGHNLPAGCLIFPNIYAIHMNKAYWKDPKEFRPERWIDSNGSLINHDYYMPFSIGRRACIGETLAKTEAFIFLTMLLQRYQFALPAGSTKPSSEGVFGITVSPAPYSVCVVPLK